jgi:micrococcal nuclease
VPVKGLAPVAALISASLSGCGDEADCGPTRGVVSRVIDGDTVVLASGQTIRYLMVDTPEITLGHDDCYGIEARDFNRALVESREVELRYDRQCKDPYGRLLAYVFVDGIEVNTRLVERGHACVLHIPPNGSERVDEFNALEEQAQNEGRGLWGFCEARSCR